MLQNLIKLLSQFKIKLSLTKDTEGYILTYKKGNKERTSVSILKPTDEELFNKSLEVYNELK